MFTVRLLTFGYTTITLRSQDLQKSSLLLSLWLVATVVIIFKLISCTEKPSSEYTYLSGSQETIHLLCTPKVHHYFSLKASNCDIIWKNVRLLISATINIGWYTVSCIWNFRFHVIVITLTNALQFFYLTSMVPVRVAIVGSSRKPFEALALNGRHQWAHFCFWISNYSLEFVTIVDTLCENYSGHFPLPYHWSSSFTVTWYSSDPKWPH